jgi:hypothetical protein
MLRRVIIAGVMLAVAVLVPIASAQTTGGDPPTFLQLTLVQPNGFGSFPVHPNPRTYLLDVSAQVTATNSPIVMTIGDGSAASGPSHGHLVSGSTVLPSPLQVSIGKTGFKSMDGSSDPVLQEWQEPIAHAPTAIHLRQQIVATDHHTGFHKLLLVTVSTESP